MKNIVIAIGLALLLGAGIYYVKTSSHEESKVHTHEGGSPHSH